MVQSPQNLELERKVRLGELLVDAHVVSSADLTEAIQVSKRLGIPIGRVLLESGCVGATVLEAALEGQPLVNKGEQSRDEIVKALKEVHATGNSLNKLMGDVGHRSIRSVDRLAELLLDSEIVSQDQLDQALMTSFESGIPLGSALVFEGILSPSLFPSILQIHKNIRDGRITKEEAVKEIKSTFMHWLKAEESLAGGHEEMAADPETREIEEALLPDDRLDAVPDAGSQRFVDFLKQAGCFSQADLQSAYSKAMDDPDTAGRVFLALGLIDLDTLKTARRSYDLADRGMLARDEAVKALNTGTSGDFTGDTRIKRYFDKAWRKKTKKRVVGGLVVGATLAGLLMKRSKGR